MRINIEKPSNKDLEVKKWKVARYDEGRIEEYYNKQARCYLKKGAATITTELELIFVKAVDLLNIPACTDCIWDVDRAQVVEK